VFLGGRTRTLSKGMGTQRPQILVPLLTYSDQIWYGNICEGQGHVSKVIHAPYPKGRSTRVPKIYCVHTQCEKQYKAETSSSSSISCCLTVTSALCTVGWPPGQVSSL